MLVLCANWIYSTLCLQFLPQGPALSKWQEWIRNDRQMWLKINKILLEGSHCERRRSGNVSYYRINVCVPSEFICWNPNPWYDGIRMWGLWEVNQVMRMEPSWTGLVPLPKTHQQALSLSFCHVRTQENSSLQVRRGLSSEFNHAGTLIRNFQAPELWDRHFCCL